MIFKKKKIEAIVYSMGRDGSAAIYDALNITPNVHVRKVYTLDREAIAHVMMRSDNDVPDHIRISENIVKNELSGNQPLHFITMVHEPFSRHVKHVFYQLQHRVGVEAVGYAVSSAQGCVDYFEATPSAQTTGWLASEYVAATGIDVFAEPFDVQAGHKIFTAGPHKLLLLSAHLSCEEQTKIISDFLNVKCAPVLEESYALAGLRDFFMAQILSQISEKIADDFWFTSFARHFFNAQQISQFQEEAEALRNRIDTMSALLEETRGTSSRETLLKDALSPLRQMPYLTAEVQDLIQKRGTAAAISTIDGLMRQMQRAQNNLLLAAMRAASTAAIKDSIKLGEQWFDGAPDERIVRTLAAYSQRDGNIARPIELWNSLDGLNEAQEGTLARLHSHEKFLRSPFVFSPRQKPAYTPDENCVIYHAYQALPYHTSGYATRTQGLVKGLANCGVDIQVMTRKSYPFDTGITPDASRESVVEGIAYHYDHSEGGGQHALPLDEYIDGAANYLVERVKHLRPRIIHSASNYMCGLAGVEAARRLGVPSVYEMRGLWHITRWSKEPDYAKSEQYALAQKLELETAHAADRVLAITGALKEWLVDHGIPAEKIGVAPNAVDIGQFQIRARDEALAQEIGCAGKIVVGYIGSFVDYEGIDLLVRAVALLPEKLREMIKLLWVGDGAAMAGLLQLASELGVSDSIISLGRRPFEQVPNLYSLVDICVFARKGVAVCEIISPLKPFEAMAMQKAVIVSDVRPLKEIISHEKTGLVHCKDDAVDLSKQLARMIESEQLRTACGKEARAWIERTRNWQHIAQDITKIYATME